MLGKMLCRLGVHHLVDFPDPNPETYGQREAQGYRACTRCVKVKDAPGYELPKRLDDRS